MKRRIIKLGKNSYAITIPSEWVKENKLKDKEELDVSINQNKMIVLNERDLKKEKTYTLDFDKYDFQTFSKFFVSCFLKNYNKIIIESKDIFKNLEVIKTLKEDNSTLEIVEMEKEKVVLKDMSNLEKLSINFLIEKMFRIVNLFFEKLLEGNSKFVLKIDKDLNKLYLLTYKKLLFNLENFCNEKNTNTIFYFKMIENLEKIGDNLKRVSRLFEKENIKKNYENITCELKEYFLFIEKIFLKNEFNKYFSSYYDKRQSLLLGIEKVSSKIVKAKNINDSCSTLLKLIVSKIHAIYISILDINI